MKKITLLLVCVLTIIACDKDVVIPEVTSETTEENLEFHSKQNSNSSKKDNKVAVCHSNEKIIYINDYAVAAHKAHGDAVDMDNDGFFDKENSCSEGVDCDDTNSSVNPGAEEIYDDEIDNNCNGVIGSMVATTRTVACTDCKIKKGIPSSGTYKNRIGGMCRDFDQALTESQMERWERCTEEVIIYRD